MRICSIILATIIMAFSQCTNQTNQSLLLVDTSDTTLTVQLLKLTEKIEEDNLNDEYYYLRSMEWIKINKLSNALVDISSALDLKPENAVYNFKKGEYLMASDSIDVQEAKKSYLKAIQLEPTFEDAHFKLGQLYLARQEYENALASFDQLIEIDINNAHAYFWKGIAYKENKFKGQAEEMFFKAVSVDNNYYNAYMQLGDLFVDKDPKNALQFYDNALRVNAKSDEALYAKGRIYQNQFKFKDAYAAYSQAVLENPGHKFASFGKAYIDIKFENYDNALKTLDNIINMAPDYSNALTLRGYAFEQLNEPKNALADYQKALEINPTDSIAKKGLQLLQ